MDNNKDRQDIVKNKAIMSLLSVNENVVLARIAAASFAARLDLTVTDIDEVKVAISEAITNAIIHGYQGKAFKDETNEENLVEFTMILYEDRIEYVIKDFGIGIDDIEQVRKNKAVKGADRMGLGFVFMESFMDKLEIKSKLYEGTEVILTKNIKKMSQTED
ncbi:anti-sigma F factor [Selenomonadales bacterium OttesenSCG-928-I06]|nr:anti-sigma F factor [Selenomonadales bacterium OttesenSCG-928-I06]